MVDYIISAVDIVASHGWRLLSHYLYDPNTAEWKHHKHTHTIAKHRLWLGIRPILASFRRPIPNFYPFVGNISYVNGKLSSSSAPTKGGAHTLVISVYF
jgi:hypothetical protein